MFKTYALFYEIILIHLCRIFSHPYQSDETISNFMVVGWYFSFLFKFKSSHLGEYACDWAFDSNSAPIRIDRKKFVGVLKHSWGVRKHSRVLVKIRNMHLKFVRKAYSQHI